MTREQICREDVRRGAAQSITTQGTRATTAEPLHPVTHHGVTGGPLPAARPRPSAEAVSRHAPDHTAAGQSWGLRPACHPPRPAGAPACASPPPPAPPSLAAETPDCTLARGAVWNSHRCQPVTLTVGCELERQAPSRVGTGLPRLTGKGGPGPCLDICRGDCPVRIVVSDFAMEGL